MTGLPGRSGLILSRNRVRHRSAFAYLRFYEPTAGTYNALMRILLFTGKGGVGKTSLAAATGVKLAELNHRTLVMSIDPAHSLGDSFDLETELFHAQTSDPLQITERLWILERSEER